MLPPSMQAQGSDVSQVQAPKPMRSDDQVDDQLRADLLVASEWDGDYDEQAGLARLQSAIEASTAEPTPATVGARSSARVSVASRPAAALAAALALAAVCSP